MRSDPPYSRSETNSRFESLRHEVRADLNGFETRMERRFGALEARFESLRAEVKVWFVVVAVIVTPFVTTLVGRVTAQVWPLPGQQVTQPQR